MKINPFAVEQWMNEFETRCRYNLAETYVDSLTLKELLDITGVDGAWMEQLLPLRLTYGAIEGSERLRAAIAGLYGSQAPANVLVTHGAAGANALVYQALIEPGDQVVCLVPTYQQHYAIPESLGAEVRQLPLKAENGYLPDLQELKELIHPKTRLIAFSNPNNPTGSLLSGVELAQMAALADSVGAYVLADEVYRGVDQEASTLGPSMADLYPRGISTGSMSKAFSLAGLRLGWIVGPTEVLKAAEVHRDYNTISVGMIDDALAALALEHHAKILDRSRRIARQNLATLDDWIRAERLLSYVKPKAGTTALVGYDFDMPSREFCVRLLKATGVLFTPGSAFALKRCVRIGYANRHVILAEGLQRTSQFLRAAGINAS